MAYFNPRTLQESATKVGVWINSGWVVFQSTHPTRECDPLVIPCQRGDQYFNPRTLQESATAKDVERLQGEIISIHAPYKRVRPKRPLARARDQHFNPRTLQESATSTGWSLSLLKVNFNPRTLQESATAIYSKKITFSQYIGLKILIRNKKYPSLK